MSEMPPSRRGGIQLGPRVPISTFPEIIEAPFPERRTVHWMPPDMVMAEELSIVITGEVLQETNRHVAGDIERERGGFLLGNRYRCPNTGRSYVTIDQYVEAHFTESTDVSLTFTLQDWDRLEEDLTGKYYGKKLVGWYHSHPRMSIFLSEHDITLHRHRFGEPWMVALVIEPKKKLGGFFAWSNGQIDPNHYVDFYELIDGQVRESVVTWNNYQGIDPINPPVPVPEPASTGPESKVPDPNSLPAAPSDGAVAAVKPPERIPDWLHGNVLRFGTAALALLVFVGIGLAVLWRGGSTAPTPRPAPDIPPRESVSEMLNSVHARLEDRGSVSSRRTQMKLWFTLTEVPDDLADRLRIKVNVDGLDSDVLKVVRSDFITVEATTVLREKVANLIKAKVDPDGMIVKMVLEYEGQTRALDDFVIEKLQLLEGQPKNLAVANFVQERTPPKPDRQTAREARGSGQPTKSDTPQRGKRTAAEKPPKSQSAYDKAIKAAEEKARKAASAATTETDKIKRKAKDALSKKATEDLNKLKKSRPEP